MAIKRQEWHPDTHPEYRFEIQYDTVDYDLSSECVGGKLNGQLMTLAAAQLAYAAVTASNRKKNTALWQLWQALPSSLKDEILNDGAPTGTFQPKPGVIVDWERTGDDTYLLRCKQLTNNQVTSANNWLVNQGITGVTVTNV